MITQQAALMMYSESWLYMIKYLFILDYTHKRYMLLFEQQISFCILCEFTQTRTESKSVKHQMNLWTSTLLELLFRSVVVIVVGFVTVAGFVTVVGYVTVVGSVTVIRTTDT